MRPRDLIQLAEAIRYGAFEEPTTEQRGRWERAIDWMRDWWRRT